MLTSTLVNNNNVINSQVGRANKYIPIVRLVNKVIGYCIRSIIY